MEYLTDASVGDFRVTPETFTDDWDPRADSAPIALANFCPFCSIATRWDVDVDPAKNVVHRESMAVVVAELFPLPVAAGLATVLAVDGDAAGAELELLEQAVIAAASTRPSAGTMMAWRAMEENRMRLRLPLRVRGRSPGDN
jgi:hypothetical protein